MCAGFCHIARVFGTIRWQTTQCRCASICAVFTSAHKFERKSAGKQLNNGMLMFVLFFTSAEGLAVKWQARSPHWATAPHCPHGFFIATQGDVTPSGSCAACAKNLKRHHPPPQARDPATEGQCPSSGVVLQVVPAACGHNRHQPQAPSSPGPVLLDK